MSKLKSSSISEECDWFEGKEVTVVFIHIHLCRKTVGYKVNQKNPYAGNLSTYLQEKVLAKQVNFIIRYLHSNYIGSECASVWKSSFTF